MLISLIKNIIINNHNKILSFIMVIAILMLEGCANRKFDKKFDQNIEKFNEFYKNEKNSADLDKVLVFNNPFKEEKPECHKADIIAEDIPLREFSNLLSELYQENISYSSNLNSPIEKVSDKKLPEVPTKKQKQQKQTPQKITLKMNDVCLADVLDSLTDSYNIGVQKMSYGYNLYLPKIQTITYEVNYHNFSRKGKSSISIVNSSLKEDQPSDSFSTIQSESEDKFWNSIEKTLRSILTATDKNSRINLDIGSQSENKTEEFYVYREGGFVVVTAMPYQHKAIRSFLDRVNKNSTRQVIIEAKILEVELSEEFSNGIQWDILKQDLKQSSLVAASSPFSTIKQLHGTANLTNETSSVNNVLSGRIAAKDFNLVLQALQTQGKISVISSPRISALNNQRALIKSGEDKYFITNVTNFTSNANSDNATNQSGFEFEPIFSGVALEATPNIINGDEVIMHIHPMVSRVEDDDKLIKIDNKDSRLPVAMITSREVDTVVKSLSGDIIILGGMTQDIVNTSKSGLPFGNTTGRLGRIFDLFAARKNFSKKVELIILIKPTIIESFDNRKDIGAYN